MAVNALNGVTVSTSSTILGRSGLTAVNGQSLSAGGGGCNTLQHSIGGAFDDVADFAFYTELSTQFTTSGGFTCCKITAELYSAGTVAAGTLTAAIFTDSGSGPGTQVGTASATVDRTTITSTPSYIEFTGVSAVLSGSTNYYVKITASSNDTDASNKVNWIQDNGTGFSSYGFRSGWGTDLLSNRSYNSKLYST